MEVEFMVRDVTLHISKRMAFKALRPDKSSKEWCRKKKGSVSRRKGRTHQVEKEIPRVLMITVEPVQSPSVFRTYLSFPVDASDASYSWRIHSLSTDSYAPTVYNAFYSSTKAFLHQHGMCISFQTVEKRRDNEHRQRFPLITVESFNGSIFVLA